MSDHPLDAADRAVLEHLLSEALELLDAGDTEGAALDLTEARAMAPHDAAVRAALGELHWARGELEAARAQLQAAVHRDPTLADAHYALARLHQEAGQHAAQVRHDLEVLRLDTATHRRIGLGGREQRALVEQVAIATLDRLAAPFDQRLADVPVVLDPRPTRQLVAEGFDPRAFGLFEGPDDFGRRSQMLSDRPTRIVVFYANLLDAFAQPDELRTQVEITLLHEIGHFFGLDEDGVDALGLR